MSGCDWDAKLYKKNSQAQEETGAAIIDAYPFRGDEIVLDIGCGDGRTTAKIAQRVPAGKVVGVDPSPNMLQEAKNTFPNLGNLSFVRSSAQELAFDTLFDLVVSFMALHYVIDHPLVLKKIYNSLKPGGTFIVVMSAGNQPDIVKVFEQEKWQRLIAKKNMVWGAKTEAEYRPMLEQAGFSDVTTKTVPGSRVYKSKEDLYNWVIAWAPHATGLGQEESCAFAKDIVESVARGRDTDIRLTSPILYAQAHKPL